MGNDTMNKFLLSSLLVLTMSGCHNYQTEEQYNNELKKNYGSLTLKDIKERYIKTVHEKNDLINDEANLIIAKILKEIYTNLQLFSRNIHQK